MHLFQREENGGDGRAGGDGEAGAGAARHDIAVPCLSVFGYFSGQMSERGADQDARPLASERQSAEKADKAPRNRADERPEPAERKHAAQDALASWNTAALDFRRFFVQKIHDKSHQKKRGEQKRRIARAPVRGFIEAF